MSEKTRLRDNMYLQLFWTFFKLGLFTIGGGMAMIPLMQGIIVDKKKWMTEEEIVDCIAVSQGLPGVIAINMATYIGHQKKGIGGAIAATIGVILPSLITIIAVVELLRGIGDNRYVNGALTGIKAAATGLIAYSAYKGPFQWVLAVAAFGLIILLDVNAVWVILAGIALGLAYEHFVQKRSGKAGEEE
jgi:chromate transporter